MGRIVCRGFVYSDGIPNIKRVLELYSEFKDSEEPSLEFFEAMEKFMATYLAVGPYPIIDLLIDLELAESKRDARTLLSQRAIRVNNKLVDGTKTVTLKDAMFNQYVMVNRGKTNAALILLQSDCSCCK